ncbi:hypothetical protein D3C72_1714970 [compost metagenome]
MHSNHVADFSFTIIDQNNAVDVWSLTPETTLKKQISFFRETFHQNLDLFTNEGFVFFTRDVLLDFHHSVVTVLFCFVINLVFHTATRSVFFWRVLEATNAIELLFCDEA